MLTSALAAQKLVETFQKGTVLDYKRGEFIIRPGEKPNAVYYIRSGLVKAYHISKYGEENMLLIRKENEVFPLIWAITGQERNVIYQALADTQVYRLSRKDYLQYIQEDTDALAMVLDLTVEMYRLHSERIITLGFRTVRERLVSFIYTLTKRFGQPDTDGAIVVTVPLKQQDIASSINATRETTGRELSYLAKTGVIENRSGNIAVPDIEKLRAFFN